MVVVTIVGVLTALIYPPYKSYVEKSSLAYTVNLLSNYKNTVVELYQSYGRLPTAFEISGDTASGVDDEGNIVSDGTQTAVLNNDLATQAKLTSIFYSPQVDNSFMLHALVKPNAFGNSNIDGKKIVFVGAMDENGSWSFRCGTGGSAPAQQSIFIQPEYLPEGCNDDLLIFE